ncbi:unnamed protein product [Paramecium primaurelia]|uniref:Transmembrane protein n=1 Tax=Paramecium primaurelia TaxID=5886 RepID=A0A8S1M4P3_PARPR|nr:unnamed protein product [Paramecium primaurelia]
MRLIILPNQSRIDFYSIISTCFYNLLLINVGIGTFDYQISLYYHFQTNQVCLLENYSKTQTKIQISITFLDPFQKSSKMSSKNIYSNGDSILLLTISIVNQIKFYQFRALLRFLTTKQTIPH